jgi:hypothetical protein
MDRADFCRLQSGMCAETVAKGIKIANHIFVMRNNKQCKPIRYLQSAKFETNLDVAFSVIVVFRPSFFAQNLLQESTDGPQH